MPKATTQGITISVEPEYLPDRSNPERNYYFFTYHVTIHNEGEQTVQLLNRHWIITNSLGMREEVRGPGVIGEQPVLEPGESFDYSSFCPLNTPQGTMEGNYEMAVEGGENFEAKIPLFTLVSAGIVYH